MVANAKDACEDDWQTLPVDEQPCSIELNDDEE
jgi:hypothetical protein